MGKIFLMMDYVADGFNLSYYIKKTNFLKFHKNYEMYTGGMNRSVS